MKRLLPLRWLAPFCMLALAGCSVLAGNERHPVTLYAPQARIATNPAWPQASWQLAIAKPTALSMVDSPRINVRPTPGELEVYRGANWSQAATDLLKDTLLRGFEDSGRIDAVARITTGIRADYKLAIDLRRFEADYAGNARPAATIELNAKLVHSNGQRVVASRTVLIAEPAAGTDVASVVAAFETALSKASTELVGWTLQAGHADQQQLAR